MEVLNDILGYPNRKIYQNTDFFSFSLDSVMLSNFVTIRLRDKNILDLGTGNGVIPLILSIRTNKPIVGVEIQQPLANLAEKSVQYNKLESQISIINCDMKDYVMPKMIERYDVITCNPPYFKVNDGSYLNSSKGKAIARHEITTNLEEIIITARYILKDKAPIYLVHRPERLIELIDLLNKYKFKIKKIQFIYASYKKRAIMVLVKATKNGADGLIVNPPVNVLDYRSYKEIFY